MMWSRSSSRFVPLLTLAAAVAWPLSASAQDEQKQRNQDEAQAAQEGQGSQEDQASREADDERQKAEDKTRKLEVFELEHRDPDQINRIISMAEQAASSAQAAQAARGQAQQGQAGLGQSAATTGRTTVGYRGVAGNKDKLVTAINAEEKILFVRGSDEQVEKVTELVDAFDVEDQELKRHEYHNVRLIPVRTSDASQVQSTLSQLDLDGQMLRMGEISVIVFQTDDTNKENKEKVDQAETVIETLNSRAQDRENGSSDADERSDSSSNSDDNSNNG